MSHLVFYRYLFTILRSDNTVLLKKRFDLIWFELKELAANTKQSSADWQTLSCMLSMRGRSESSNGISPVTVMNSTTPRLHESDNMGLYGVPRSTSGATYAALPQYVELSTRRRVVCHITTSIQSLTERRPQRDNRYDTISPLRRRKYGHSCRGHLACLDLHFEWEGPCIIFCSELYIAIQHVQNYKL